MADTIIERNTSTDTGDTGGWAVAVIILLAVVVIGGLYFYYHRGAAPAAPAGTNINVTLPGGTTGGTGATTP